MKAKWNSLDNSECILIKNEKMKKLLVIAIALFLTSCDTEYDNEYDFRNHLRDMHPYAEIIEIDWGHDWAYQVNDTIKGDIWIYVGAKQKSDVEKHCINCPSDE